MSKMIELVEEMRARLNQITDTEQSLVRALGEALSRVDQKLLQDVLRIGAFPMAHEPAPGLEYAERAAKPIAAANGNQNPFTRGDWRQAASNIEDELDSFFKDRAASH